MVQDLWACQNRKITVCVDSYQDGILRGRFYGPEQRAETFDSLSQFLLKMDTLMEETRIPQAYTATRSFSQVLLPQTSAPLSDNTQKGCCATFQLQILFRQHTSWQGILLWQEQQLEQSFRSVLELVLLMDSALRTAAGREAS